MARRLALEDIERRLLARSAVSVDGPVVRGVRCREWFRARHDQGYGRMSDGERLQYTHRLAWEVWRAPIPDGKDVCHHCDNPRCIEIEHLWCGTHQENMADCDAKGRRRNGSDKLRGRPNLHLRGSRHPNAELVEAQVREIKERLLIGDRPADLAREFKVSDSLVRRIKKGLAWRWLVVRQPGAEPIAIENVKPAPPKKFWLDDHRRPRFVGKKLKEALRGFE